VTRLAIAKGFLAEYGKLGKAVQSAVDATVANFAKHARPTLHLEKPEHSRDDRIRLIRVDDRWRVIMLAPLTGDTYCLVTVLPLAEANAYVTSHRFSVNRAFGILEVGDEETIQQLQRSLRAAAEPDGERLFADVSDADLTALGIDAQILPTVRLLTCETDLETLGTVVPEAQYAALHALARGMAVDEARDEVARLYSADTLPEQIDPGDLVAAMERTLGQVTFVSGREELQLILAHPFAAWRKFLYPNQRKIAYRESYSGPTQVTGGPGTGKTVTVLHRAAFLATRAAKASSTGDAFAMGQASTPEPYAKPILLTTFNGNLAEALDAQLDLFIRDVGVRRQIEALNVDRLAYSIVRQARGNPVIADERVMRTRWAEAAEAELTFTPAFLKNEWEQVILAQDVHTEQAYLTCPRTGRGRPLSKTQRSRVWQAIQRVTARLAAARESTHLQLANEATHLLQQAAVPRYRHILIDEAQDLHPSQWRLLRAAVAPGPDDLFIAADPHQRIYDNRVSLASLGISVRGRSRRLSLNYRTTQEILAWAVPVLGEDPVTGLDGEVDSLLGYRSPMHGEPPQLRVAATRGKEFEFLAERIHAWKKAGIEPQAIGVTARSASLVREAREVLEAGGIATVSLSGRGSSQTIRAGVMHAIKGLEFQAIAVIGVEEGLVPEPAAVTPESEDAVAHAQDLQRERCVLFVACTRARDYLYVSGTGQPSMFLPPREADPPPSSDNNVSPDSAQEQRQGRIHNPAVTPHPSYHGNLAAGTHQAWERYELWNQAFSRVVFSARNEGRPVYLDMDEDVLGEVASEAGFEPTQAADQLTEAVRGTLYLEASDGPVFWQHTEKLRLWRYGLRASREKDDLLGPPPVLGLLAVTTLAAEEMGGDSAFAANAYYPRLFRLLRIDDSNQQRRIESAYRKQAENLWRGLNEWLSATDGRFGSPTAYALSHRYIGLPLSQALVRSADRRQFPLMFHRCGLPPGGEISPADMERLIDSWLQMRPCPVSKSLESLWRRGQARERIASVAAIELLSWDGTPADYDPAGSRRTGGVQLLCWLRRFPKRRLEISFLAQLGTQASPQALAVLTAIGKPSVDVVPVAGARLQPVLTSEIDTTSLVEGVLRLADTSGGPEVTRFPRLVVPFRYDDLLNAYVECERVQLGEDSMLLVRDDRGLPESVHAILGQIARPGFREETVFPGLPAGWVLFAAVQVVATPNPEPTGIDLNTLVPLLSSQLALAGGTKLPGGLRKWSSLDPPEVRAVAQGATALSVALDSMDETSGAPGLPRTWTSDEPTLVADIKALALPDGDYEVSMLDGRKTVHQSTLRLRSSNTPDAATRHAVAPLAHDISDDPLAVLRATPLRPGVSADAVVRGPRAALYHTPPATVITARKDIWWNAPKPPPSPRPLPITLTALDPASCVVTGAHYIELPPAYGAAKGGLISGVCKYCGLTKRYPARIRWHRDESSRHTKQSPALHVNVSHLPEAAPPGHSDWYVAFDSLVHVHGGNYHSFEYVANQVEGSSLFTDTFSRSLEVRGDLEIERGPDFAPVCWELSPAYLAELTTGGFLLTGCWSRDDRDALRELVEKAGGTLTSGRDQHGLARHVVTEVTAADLARIAATIGTASVAPEAAARLVAALPPLGELEAALPRVPLPSARRVLRFHLESASWVQRPFAGEPGAYRLEQALARKDVFLTPADVEAGTAALATVQLSKHLAARRFGRALLAYSPDQQVLAVPLGADLPGLYGRAAVLCGGRLPTPDERRRLLLYHDVPQRVADALTFLLTS
jgi:superfamily I DNA/RNA helicase